MGIHGTNRHRSASLWRVAAILIVCYGFGLASVGAASIPAWLDDAISEWNGENPGVPIKFVEIKDQYVWYTVPNTAETGQKQIRESVYGIVQRHGYQQTEAEELVTTGRPPNTRQTKCWTRSFTLDLEVGRQRLLTTQVCVGDESWFAGFRVIQ